MTRQTNLVTGEGVWLRCQRCFHIWRYKGSRRFVSCASGNCKTSVTVARAKITKEEAASLLAASAVQKKKAVGEEESSGAA